MQKKLFKSVKDMKKVLKASAAALMGAVMISASCGVSSAMKSSNPGTSGESSFDEYYFASRDERLLETISKMDKDELVQYSRWIHRAYKECGTGPVEREVREAGKDVGIIEAAFCSTVNVYDKIMERCKALGI